MENVANVNDLSLDEFNERYFNKWPVLFKGGIKNTKCYKDWSPDYLKKVIGARLVNISHSQSGVYNVTVEEDFPELVVEFDKAVDLFASKHEAYYLFKLPIFQHFPELLEDLEIPKFIDTESDKIAGINFWMGGRGCVTPLYYDSDHNFLLQVCGRKELTLFSPEDTSNLYFKMVKETPPSEVDIANVDERRFPLFKHARPIYC